MSAPSSSDLLPFTEWSTWTEGERAEAAYVEILDMLRQPRPRPEEKEACKAWSPGTFRNNYRNAEHFESAWAVVHDVDVEPVPSLESIVNALGNIFRGFVHSTWSHLHAWESNPNGTERWRVAPLLSRPVVTKEEYALVWEWTRRQMPFKVGVSTKDCSRLWYAPCPDVHGNMHFAELQGEPVDVDAVLHVMRAEAEKAAKRAAKPSDPMPSPGHLSPEEEEDLVVRLAATDPKAQEPLYIVEDDDTENRNAWRPAVYHLLTACGHDHDSAARLTMAVGERIGADLVELSAIVKNCASHKGKKRGWPWWRKHYGNATVDALRAAANPREEMLRQVGVRMAESLREKTKKPETSPGVNRAEMLADLAERAQQADEATVEWDLVVGDGPDLAKNIAAHVERIGARFVFAEGKFYRYDDACGIWSDDAEDRLRRWIWTSSGTPKGDNKYALKNGDVTFALQVLASNWKNDEFFSSAADGIACPNGFLRVSKDGAELLPHAPEHRARAVYPLEYERDADLTEVRRFFNELFVHDEDRAEKVACLGEFFGASFFGFVTRYQRGVIAQGEGENGKSTVGELMAGMFPKGSVASIQPHQMAQENFLADLDGKLLNVVDELRNSALRETDACKSAIVGRTLAAKRVYKDATSFTPVAGHFFGANNLPTTGDQSHGFWRRWIVISFLRNFKLGGGEKDIAKRLLRDHRAALFAWLVQGAVRLLAQDGYTVPSSHEKALKAWRDGADPVAHWISEACDVTEEPCMTTEELFPFFKSWCESNNYRPVTSHKFGSTLNSLGYDRLTKRHLRCLLPKDKHARAKVAARAAQPS